MNWKKLVIMGMGLVAASILANIMWGTVAPSQVSIIATQQAEDTTEAHIATRAVSEASGAFGIGCNVVLYAGFLLIFASLILFVKESMDNDIETTNGGETAQTKTESKTNKK